MPNNSGEGRASPVEAEKLIEEMQRLIKFKGLDVTLTEDHPGKAKLLTGCTQCTLCTCIIGPPC
ncbi:MAG: hypothetical protein ACLPM3_11000 [Terracidiphilus sp.]